jgi:hypothetical protein
MHRGGRGGDAHKDSSGVRFVAMKEQGKAGEKRAEVYPSPTNW